MTDGEPEPFRMSTDPDETLEPDDAVGADDPAPADDAPADDAPAAPLGLAGVESIADLIDEASRTAAEQAVQDALGETPEDRSADVWGPVDGGDAEDVWSAASHHNSGSRVFDDAFGDADDAWAASSEHRVSAAADPNVGFDDAVEHTPGEAPEEEPEVYTFAVDDEPGEVVAAEDLAAGLVLPNVAATTDDDASSEDDTLAVLDEVIEDEDGWADEAWSDRVEAADEAADDVETPEPFRFAAGPGTTAPAEVPDHVATADEREPDAFSFAFDATDDGTQEEQTMDTGSQDRPAEDEDPWAASDPSEPTDDVWSEPDPADAAGVWEDETGAVDEAVWTASSDDAGDANLATGDDAPHAPDPLDPLDTPATAAAPAAAPDPLDPLDTPATAPAATAATAPDPLDPLADLGAGELDGLGDEADDGAWTFDVADEADDGPTLADTAVPRPDTGWNDLEEEPATWTLPATQGARGGGDEEPDAFAAVLGETDADAAQDDEPDGFTAAIDDEPDGFTAAIDEDAAFAATVDADAGATEEPAVVAETPELQGALGDLLGGITGQPVPAPDPAPAEDALADFDDLDDVLDDLADLDGFGPADEPAPAIDAPPPGGTPAFADAPPPAVPQAAPPAFRDEEPPVAEAPPPSADDDTDEPTEDDEPAAAPAPVGMTTFSAKKAKKRGLFG